MHFHEIFQFLHLVLVTTFILIFTSIISAIKEAFSHQAYIYLLDYLNTNEEKFLRGYEGFFHRLPNFIARFFLKPAALRMIAVELRFDKKFKSASPAGKIGMAILEPCKAAGLQFLCRFQEPIKHNKLHLMEELIVNPIEPLPSTRIDTSVNDTREVNDVY